MNVSIVMPAYNSASTIGEALESVVAQTHSAWEVIVVDDGSTDATGELARQFASRDERIRVVSQPNGGESCARNTGVGHSGYDWLHFLDADDWIAPACLERLTAELVANPELDAVHCRTVRVAKDGTLVNDDYMAPSGDLFPTLARRAAFFVHACTVRRSLVEEVGRFDTSLKKAADWDLWQRIARTGARFGAVREVLAYYRMTPNSSSLEAEQLFCDVLTVLRRGHSTDPRVRNPHPDYVYGWRGNTVESQEFYLLAWCAGLMMGRGKDAKRLLKAVKNDRYAELYPPAVALSIFEAATLPTCEPPRAWETIWPNIHALAEKFLVALERQSGTPDLASRALLELKRLVLKHSTTWAPVIAEQDLEKARLEQSAEGLKRDKALFETQAADLQQVVETLKFEGISLRDDLSRRQQEKAALQTEATNWARTASRLEQDNKSLENQSGNWQQLTERLQQENASLIGNWERLASALTQEKKSLEEQRSTWQELAARLEQERASLTADLGSSHQVVSRLEQEKASLTTNLDSSHQVASRLEREKASLTTNLDSSHQVVSRLEQEKASLTADLGSSHQVASRLEQEKASLAADLDSSHQVVSRLEQEKASLTADLSSSHQVVSGLEQEKALLTANLSSSHQVASRLEQEKASLTADLASSHQIVSRLEQEKTSLTADLGSSHQVVSRLEEAKASLTAELSNWREVSTRLEQEKKSLDQQTSSLQDLAAGLEQTKTSLAVELAGWQQTASRLEQEKRSAEEQAERLQQDKESLKRDLYDAASRGDALEQDMSSLVVEAGAWKRLAGQRESAIAALRNRTWIRLGASSGLLKTPGLASDGIQGDPSEFITKTAELRIAGGSIAKLLLPTGNLDVLRIDIEKIGTKTPWDIQVNLANLKVKANQRYTVCFRARADERRSLMVGFAKAYEPWDSLGLFRNVELTTEWRTFQEDFVAIADDENARIHFDLGDRNAAVEISAVKLRTSHS